MGRPDLGARWSNVVKCGPKWPKRSNMTWMTQSGPKSSLSILPTKFRYFFLEHPVYVQLYIDGCNDYRDRLLKYRVKLCFLKQLYKSVCVLFFQDCRDGMQTENVLDFFSLSNICTLN